jgi:hypothetical protein
MSPRSILLYDESNGIRRLKGRHDVRSGMIGIPLEGFEVNGAIAAVHIATSFQRNSDIGRLRSVGGRNHKRDNSKDGGEREMHLCRQAELEDRRVRREGTGLNLKHGLSL